MTLGQKSDFSQQELDLLKELGIDINYNGYGVFANELANRESG